MKTKWQGDFIHLLTYLYVSGVQVELIDLLKTVVQTNSDTMQSTQALMLAVLQNQDNRNLRRGIKDTDSDNDSIQLDEGGLEPELKLELELELKLELKHKLQQELELKLELKHKLQQEQNKN